MHERALGTILVSRFGRTEGTTVIALVRLRSSGRRDRGPLGCDELFFDRDEQFQVTLLATLSPLSPIPIEPIASP